MEKYAKLKKIGEGSFGKALLVRHKESGKQFVVKEINMSKMAKKERDEARKEVAVLAQLNHPNIVTYRESFEEIGNLYIVMDYCDAGDLYGRINTQRGILFDENQIVDWFVQTCLAIKHIHDRKILHRDIKSQNIFLTKHGIVKLGDFGIAKVLNSTVELARTCIGTPYYLSPEICENKPYNNKSDIWSLGCVLYELTTLKHAFESGNMKNLVLKIIRGNFPPPPPRYSYELRSLINQLFKRSPRDRPSINSVLKKPILQQRIKKFLSESEVADEFSHTVMHGVKMKKVLPAGGVRPLPPKPAAVRKPPSVPAPSPRYNPASVYGVPVNRKSKDAGPVKKSLEVRKSGGAKKPSNSGGAGAYNADLARKKQELLEKERKRREEANKKEDMYAKQHRELIEKQKMARMKKAREEGWKNLVDSLSSDDSNKKVSPHGAKLSSKKKQYISPYSQKKSTPRSSEFKKPTPVYKPVRAAAAANPVKDQRPNYEQYHDYLDKLDRQRKAAADAGAAAARPVSARDSPAPGREKAGGGVDPHRFDPAYNAMKGQAAGAQGHVAAEKARMVEEYMQRKQQAAVNKARAHGDLYGGAKYAVNPPKPAPSPKPSSGAPKPSAGQQKPQSSRDSDSRSSDSSAKARARPLSEKDRQEQEYLARLKQIRLQNFNERKSVQDKGHQKGDNQYKPPKVIDSKNDADARKKKIEALRAQADERAKKLKAELEHKRKEAYDLEKRNLQLRNAARQQQARPVVAAKPAPVVPITHVMGAIGAAPTPPQPSKAGPSVGMTAAMNAIGASRDEENRASIQKTKEQILKRLNAKPPDKPIEKEAPAAASENKPDRLKWGTPVKPPVVADRPKWGEEGSAPDLHSLALEQTASQMEVTSAQDRVLKHGEKAEDGEGDSQPSSRKQWASRPSGTVVNMLKAAGLNETSSSNISVASDSSESSGTAVKPSVGGSTVTLSKPSENNLPVIGTTITISKSPNKGTVVIKKAEDVGDHGDVPDAQIKPLQSHKELVIDEEKEEDESEKEEPEKEEPQKVPQAEKDELEKVPTNSDTVKTPEKAKTPEKLDIEQDKKARTDLTPPRLKSRSPSPKPRSPKTSPVKPKKIYQPEVQVEIKDLPEEKSALFSKVELDDEERDHKDEGTGQEDAVVVEDLEEGEIIDVRGDTPEPGEVHVQDGKQKSGTNLLLGLTTGHFDIGDVKLLRTCSEPNLSMLFKTDLVDNPFFTDDEVRRSVQAAAELLEEHYEHEDEDEAAQVRASLQKVMDQDEDDEEENEENLGYSVRDIADLIGDEEDEDADTDQEDVEEEEGEEMEDEEQEQEQVSTDEGDGSDGDMETLRQSMMEILDNTGTVSDEESISSKKKTKKGSTTSKVGKDARKKRRDKKEAEEAAAKAGDDEQKSLYGRQWSASSVEDFQNMRETMKTLLQSDSGKKKLASVKEAGPGGDAADGPPVAADTILSLNSNTEAWQSDDDTVDDDYWEEEDMFSRLEESRMKLEEELGCDTFMKAYKTVQAIHEDEDENMEEGLKLVTKILGEQKTHLYPSILQLVMADGVWTEDNE